MNDTDALIARLRRGALNSVSWLSWPTWNADVSAAAAALEAQATRIKELEAEIGEADRRLVELCDIPRVENGVVNNITEAQIVAAEILAALRTTLDQKEES